jgi:hypothetical protein
MWSGKLTHFTRMARSLWNQHGDSWFSDFDTDTQDRSIYGKWNGQVIASLYESLVWPVTHRTVI